MNFLVGTWKTSVGCVSMLFEMSFLQVIAVVLTVNLFECQLLGLSDEAEDHEPGYQV